MAKVELSHPGIARPEVAVVLEGRWSGLAVVDVDALGLSWAMSTEDAAELARTRRGVEPMRVVVLPQRAADAEERGRTAAVGGAPPWLEPMPILF